jgi:SAM-dependent methyltransferase
MNHDSAGLSEFYASPIGQVARRVIQRRLREVWPDTEGTRILGYGFAIPYLRSLSVGAELATALVPEQLGPWPSDACPSVVALEDALPFADAMFDRVLVIHGLESAESLRPLLRQLWRVLAPSGKLLLVAPNRTSLWAQVERSPFAHGRPFNRAQLANLLRDTLYAPERWESALLMLPLKSRRLLGRGISWEKIGRRFWPALAGVHIVEATKSMYALTPPLQTKQGRRVFASARG